jgi:putative membrane protein
MPRLLVHITEASAKPEPEKSILTKQLMKMGSGLWFGITWPSAVITLMIGASLLITQPAFLEYGFMHIKLTLVFFLYLYHFSIHYLFGQLKRGVVKFSSTQLRLWNEVATLFLISIVFLIVLKSALSIVWGVAGLLVITFLIMMGVRIYKKYRNEK